MHELPSLHEIRGAEADAMLPYRPSSLSPASRLYLDQRSQISPSDRADVGLAQVRHGRQVGDSDVGVRLQGRCYPGPHRQTLSIPWNVTSGLVGFALRFRNDAALH